MKAYVLPITKYGYYGGTVSQSNAEKIYSFYHDIKKYLKTDGSGWTNFDGNIKRPLKLIAKQLRNNIRSTKGSCEQLAFYDETATGLNIPLPSMIFNNETPIMFVPLRDNLLINLHSDSYSDILPKYYYAAKNCLKSRSPKNEAEFDNKFSSWLTNEVLTKVDKDEDHLCYALGGILALAMNQLTSKEYLNNIISFPRIIEIGNNKKCYKTGLDTHKIIIFIMIIFFELIGCILVLLCMLCSKSRKKKKQSCLSFHVMPKKIAGTNRICNSFGSQTCGQSTADIDIGTSCICLDSCGGNIHSYGKQVSQQTNVSDIITKIIPNNTKKPSDCTAYSSKLSTESLIIECEQIKRKTKTLVKSTSTQNSHKSSSLLIKPDFCLSSGSKNIVIKLNNSDSCKCEQLNNLLKQTKTRSCEFNQTSQKKEKVIASDFDINTQKKDNFISYECRCTKKKVCTETSELNLNLNIYQNEKTNSCECNRNSQVKDNSISCECNKNAQLKENLMSRECHKNTQGKESSMSCECHKNTQGKESSISCECHKNTQGKESSISCECQKNTNSNVCGYNQDTQKKNLISCECKRYINKKAKLVKCECHKYTQIKDSFTSCICSRYIQKNLISNECNPCTLKKIHSDASERSLNIQKKDSLIPSGFHLKVLKKDVPNSCECNLQTSKKENLNSCECHPNRQKQDNEQNQDSQEKDDCNCSNDDVDIQKSDNSNSSETNRNNREEKYNLNSFEDKTDDTSCCQYKLRTENIQKKDNAESCEKYIEIQYTDNSNCGIDNFNVQNNDYSNSCKFDRNIQKRDNAEPCANNIKIQYKDKKTYCKDNTQKNDNSTSYKFNRSTQKRDNFNSSKNNPEIQTQGHLNLCKDNINTQKKDNSKTQVQFSRHIPMKGDSKSFCREEEHNVDIKKKDNINCYQDILNTQQKDNSNSSYDKLHKQKRDNSNSCEFIQKRDNSNSCENNTASKSVTTIVCQCSFGVVANLGIQSDFNEKIIASQSLDTQQKNRIESNNKDSKKTISSEKSKANDACILNNDTTKSLKDNVKKVEDIPKSKDDSKLQQNFKDMKIIKDSLVKNRKITDNTFVKRIKMIKNTICEDKEKRNIEKTQILKNDINLDKEKKVRTKPTPIKEEKKIPKPKLIATALIENECTKKQIDGNVDTSNIYRNITSRIPTRINRVIEVRIDCNTNRIKIQSPNRSRIPLPKKKTLDDLDITKRQKDGRTQASESDPRLNVTL
ncbi:general transcriptional corepressor trfA-like isoform X2 [Plodia interpunctella]|nr:general transcriptional corepressor trfA-like isoform X2 [Plodia interpunctella]